MKIQCKYNHSELWSIWRVWEMPRALHKISECKYWKNFRGINCVHVKKAGKIRSSRAPFGKSVRVSTGTFELHCSVLHGVFNVLVPCQKMQPHACNPLILKRTEQQRLRSPEGTIRIILSKQFDNLQDYSYIFLQVIRTKRSHSIGLVTLK